MSPCTSVSHLLSHLDSCAMTVTCLSPSAPTAATLCHPCTPGAPPSILSMLYTAGFSQRMKGFSHCPLPAWRRSSDLNAPADLADDCKKGLIDLWGREEKGEGLVVGGVDGLILLLRMMNSEVTGKLLFLKAAQT